MQKQIRVEESSDDELSSLSSRQGSSTQISQLDDTSATQPSLQLLRENDRTQRKVQKHLEQLQGRHRGSEASGKSIKSGLHHSGDNAVKLRLPGPTTSVFPVRRDYARL